MLGAVIKTREPTGSLRVKDEFAKGLEVRLKSWFWDLDPFLGLPGPFSLSLLSPVVLK